MSCPCQDMKVSASVEAGAKSLQATSYNDMYNSDHIWKYATPHIRNRWRQRFIQAHEAAMRVINQPNEM